MCRSWGPHWGWVPCGPTPWLLLSLVCSAPFGMLGEETRQVSMEVISGWPTPQNLLHIRAVGTNSTLHYVWSTLGPPAVVLVATNTTQSVLSVNWSLLLSPDPEGGLMVLPKDSIQFSSALVFTRLLEFDSTRVPKGAAQPSGKPYPPYSLAEFSWNDINNSLDLATLSAIFQGHPVDDPAGAFANGSLAFKVQAFSGSGRPAQPPRLLHTADVCQLEVTLAGASPRGNHSLFGLELDQLLWGSSPSGFMQWRPVAFSQKQRGLDSALSCQSSSLHPTLAYPLPQSPIVQAFFGSPNNFCTFNLTFGDPTGPGYWDQHYLSWSMLLGVGMPPVDNLSPLVLGIMAVALGTPGLMLLGGGLFLLLCQKQHPEYQSLN
ncbi:glycosylated lysosomal membrane protein isoform X2 [Onychomys torridus]|uniref:glycosylated lysosomal membrane protein isoform X2 n=1 Tax=Onychomys torridus TaxID=38674 RepID=UPI00167FAF41|nr:glycosylated lysosomal membrane protein isoform X2 [Onychomys torridus]